MVMWVRSNEYMEFEGSSDGEVGSNTFIKCLSVCNDFLCLQRFLCLSRKFVMPVMKICIKKFVLYLNIFIICAFII